MRERSIMMQDESVLGILDGTKLQSRRLMKPQPAHLQLHEWRGKLVYEGEHRLWCWRGHTFENLWDFGEHNEDRKQLAKLSPYGVVGDRLWCKEAWRTEERESDAVDGIRFRADNAFVPIANTREAADRWVVAHENGKHGDRWRSPLFMPRWASRLTLELVDVRAQRLQEISEADAKAEGVAPLVTLRKGYPSKRAADIAHRSYRDGYAVRWDAINGRRAPWASNPFVWALTFRRVP
jgi:hypothetical protein